MKRGLVFGKFYPFHRGHEQLIAFARSHCEQLSILVCVSNKEKISSNVRASWIRDAYQNDPMIEVVCFDYDESELPNSSQSSRDISKIWSKALKKMFPHVTTLCTAEPYGDYVAEYMNIEHISFVRQGGISATNIRADMHGEWNNINEVARRFFLKKVVVAGTESTGKSTLCQQLADHFATVFVPEAGRSVVPRTDECTESYLVQILDDHARLIDEHIPRARQILFIDTDAYTTVSYSKFLFGKQLPTTDYHRSRSKADLYLYLSPDAPYVQDGTRLDIERRNALDRMHRETYEKEGIQLQLLSGSYEERYAQAVSLVSTQVINATLIS